MPNPRITAVNAIDLRTPDGEVVWEPFVIGLVSEVSKELWYRIRDLLPTRLYVDAHRLRRIGMTWDFDYHCPVYLVYVETATR